MKTIVAIIAMLIFATSATADPDVMEQWQRDDQQRQYREQQERRTQDLERRQQEIEGQRNRREWTRPQVSPPGDSFRVNPQFKPYAR